MSVDVFWTDILEKKTGNIGYSFSFLPDQQTEYILALGN